MRDSTHAERRGVANHVDHRDHALWSWVTQRLVDRCPVGRGASSIVAHDDSRRLSECVPSRAITKRAIHAELGGLIWSLTPPSMRATLPNADRLSKLWLSQSSAHLMRSSALARHWPREEGPPLLIKGADLELSLYPEAGLSLGARASSDWDILIPKPRYDQVVQRWRALFGEPSVPRSVRLSHEPPHELGFLVDGLLIEVHHEPAPRFFSLLSGEGLWERAQPAITPEGLEVRIPAARDRLLIWLVNYAKAGGMMRPLGWLDLTLIMRDALRGAEVSPMTYLRGEAIEYGLLSALESALISWATSPLSLLCPTLLSELHDLAPVKVCSNSPLTPIRIGLNQVRFCAPQLRAEYLSRAAHRLLTFKERSR